MKKLTLAGLTVALLAAAAVAQAAGSQGAASTPASKGAQASATQSDQANHSPFRVAEGSVFHVVLAKNVDARKNKIGDEVTTTIVEDLKSNGGVIIPKNSKIIGHITQIEAHSKEHPASQIAIAFDRLVIQQGGEIPLSASIQAVAAPETAPADDNDQASMGHGDVGGGIGASGGRGGSSSGVTGRAIGAENPIGRDAGRATGNYSGGLSAASQGVIGLKGLSLSTPGAVRQGSVISSDHQNVHLERGTQFVLRVNPQ